MEFISLFLKEYKSDFGYPHWLTLRVDQQGKDTKRLKNRISKQKTVNGNVIVLNAGFVESDRDFKFQIIPISRYQIDHLVAITKLSEELYISTNEGLYSCFINQFYDYDSDRPKLDIVLSGTESLNIGLVDQNPEPPPVSNWVSIFDNTKWESYYTDTRETIFDGSKWVRGSSGNWSGLVVKTGETWNVGFTPSKVRMIYDAENSGGVNQWLELYDANGNNTQVASGSVENGLSGIEYTIDYSGFDSDLFEIWLYVGTPSGDYVYINNIEFLNE